jgi:hypothetical protein
VGDKDIIVYTIQRWYKTIPSDMSHYDGEVRGLHGYHRLIEWLNSSWIFRGDPGYAMPLTFFDSLDNVGDAQVTQQLTAAFRRNGWMYHLIIKGIPPSNLMPLLQLLHEFKVMKYLDLFLEGSVAGTAPGISKFLLGPAPSSLEHVGFHACHFDGDFRLAWDAIEENEWLQTVEFYWSDFDEANTNAFVTCFKKSKKGLSRTYKIPQKG